MATVLLKITGTTHEVALQDANLGDTTTVMQTINVATENLAAVADDPRTADTIHPDFMSEAVLDKGYHSNETLLDLDAMDVRSYASEPDRGRRKWDDKGDAQKAVYANRRRIKGDRDKALLRSRGELVERTFAHAYETGGMRRTHLRGQKNILKRLLVHTDGFNLGVAIRKLVGVGKPRRLQGLFSPVFSLLRVIWLALWVQTRRQMTKIGFPLRPPVVVEGSDTYEVYGTRLRQRFGHGLSLSSLLSRDLSH